MFTEQSRYHAVWSFIPRSTTFLPVTSGKEHCTHFVTDRRDGFCNAVRNRTKTHPLLPGTEGFFLSLFQQPASLFRDTGKHVVILPVRDNCSSDWLTSCTIWHHCLQNQHPRLQLRSQKSGSANPKLCWWGSPSCVHPNWSQTSAPAHRQIAQKANPNGSQE